MTSLEWIEVKVLEPEPVILQGERVVSISRTDSFHLFVYLVIEGQIEYDRTKLGLLIFGDDSQPGRLRDAIYQLRKALNGACIPHESASESRKLHFNREMVRLDSEEFSRRATVLLNQPDHEVNPAFEREAQSVLALYRADFLQGFLFNTAELDHWSERRRMELAHLRHRLLERLVRFSIQQGALTEAQQYGETWHQSTGSGFLPLQYLLWVAITRRQYAAVNEYLRQLQTYEADEAIIFGPSVRDWRRLIQNNEAELLPSLLHIPTSIVVKAPMTASGDFVGREGIIRQVTDLLLLSERPEVIGIVGLAGAGKTRFAQQVVQTLSVGQPKYDVVWIELNPESDLEGILNEVLSQLQMHSLLALDYAVKQRHFRQLLQAHPSLVVIDEGMSRRLSTPDFLHALVDLLEGTRLLLIARQFPGVDYYTIDLPGFDAALVHQYLVRDLPYLESSDPAIYNSLTAITGGLPLLLNLVIGFLKDRRFGIRSLLKALADLEHEQWSPETANALYEQILAWFWKLLTPDEKNALYSVSLFDSATGCTDDAIIAVVGTALSLSSSKVQEKLETVVSLRLLQIEQRLDAPTRYTLHPIIYDDIHRRSEQSGTQVDVRHIQAAYNRHIIDFVAAHSSDFLDLDEQKYNIVRMFTSILADNSLPDIHNEVIGLLNRVYDYFDRRGLYSTVESLLRYALAIQPLDDQQRTQLLCHLGQAAFKQSRLDEARQWLWDAYEQAQQSDLPSEYAVILRDLGRTHFYHGEYDTAIDYLEQGMAYAADQNQVILRAQIMANLGVIDDLRGRYDQAQHWLEQIIVDLNDQAGDKHLGYMDVLQFVQNMLGLIAMAKENYPQAHTHLQQSLAMARSLNNPERIARVYLNLGVLSYNQSDFDGALEYFTQGTIVAEYIQHAELLTLFNWNKGALYVIRHHYKVARRLLHTALNQANDLDLRPLVPNILIWLGILHFDQTQLRQAERYFIEVFILPALNPWFTALALYGLGLVTRFEQDLLKTDDIAMATQQVIATLQHAQLDRTKLPTIATNDLERAQVYYQRALEDIPELKRYRVVEALNRWLAGDS